MKLQIQLPIWWAVHFLAVVFSLHIVSAERGTHLSGGFCTPSSGGASNGGSPNDPWDFEGAVEMCRKFFVEKEPKCPYGDCSCGGLYANAHECCVCSCRNYLPMLGWSRTGQYSKDLVEGDLEKRTALFGSLQTISSSSHGYCFELRNDEDHDEGGPENEPEDEPQESPGINFEPVKKCAVNCGKGSGVQ